MGRHAARVIRYGVVAALALATGLAAPAPAAGGHPLRQALVLRGTTTAYADVVLTRPLRWNTAALYQQFHERPAVTAKPGGLAGFVIVSAARPLDGPAVVGVRRPAPWHDWLLTMRGLNGDGLPLTAAEGLPPGAYRAYLVADRDQVVTVHLPGQPAGRSDLRPSRRTAAQWAWGTTVSPSAPEAPPVEGFGAARRVAGPSLAFLGEWVDVPAAAAKNVGFCYWYGTEPPGGAYAVPGCPGGHEEIQGVTVVPVTDQKWDSRTTTGLPEAGLWGIGGHHEFAGVRRNPGWMVVWVELGTGAATRRAPSYGPVLPLRATSG